MMKRAPALKLVASAFFFLSYQGTSAAADHYTGFVLDGDKFESNRLAIKMDGGGRYFPAYDPPPSSVAEATSTQVGFDQVQISPDRDIVGWVSLYPNCCTSYPLPLQLVLVKNGFVFWRLDGGGLSIWKWRFEQNGKQVVIRQNFPHGPDPDHFELYDIATQQRIEAVDIEQEAPESSIPLWARGLR